MVPRIMVMFIVIYLFRNIQLHLGYFSLTIFCMHLWNRNLWGSQIWHSILIELCLYNHLKSVSGM